jgi:hypothetical protein
MLFSAKLSILLLVAPSGNACFALGSTAFLKARKLKVMFQSSSSAVLSSPCALFALQVPHPLCGDLPDKTTPFLSSNSTVPSGLAIADFSKQAQVVWSSVSWFFASSKSRSMLDI